MRLSRRSGAEALLKDGTTAGTRRIRTKPKRPRCCASRSAVTRAITSRAVCTRFLPAKGQGPLQLGPLAASGRLFPEQWGHDP